VAVPYLTDSHYPLTAACGRGHLSARAFHEFTEVQTDHTFSSSFAVDVGRLVTIASPVGGEVRRQGSTHAIRWTLSAPVDEGYFTVWASPPSGDTAQLTTWRRGLKQTVRGKRPAGQAWETARRVAPPASE
jgi:hypothetical protein